jgi:hypothetical protein
MKIACEMDVQSLPCLLEIMVSPVSQGRIPHNLYDTANSEWLNWKSFQVVPRGVVHFLFHDPIQLHLVRHRQY